MLKEAERLERISGKLCRHFARRAGCDDVAGVVHAEASAVSGQSPQDCKPILATPCLTTAYFAGQPRTLHAHLQTAGPVRRSRDCHADAEVRGNRRNRRTRRCRGM